MCFLYIMSGDWWGYQWPSPHMQGWVSTMMDLKLVFSFTLSFSHTLSFLRGVVQSVTLKKVPFPSISGKLQRSVIREINGTGPISCLVPFVSAKMLRTSKKMSKFIGIYCACYANVKHIQPLPMHLLTKLKCTQPPHTENTIR